EDLVSIRDVSMGGIGLARVLPRGAGERYILALKGRDSGESQVLEAQVVWFRGGQAGLRWFPLDLDQQQWLRDQLGSRAPGPEPGRASPAALLAADRPTDRPAAPGPRDRQVIRLHGRLEGDSFLTLL